MTDALAALRDAIAAGRVTTVKPLPTRPDFDYAVRRFLAAWVDGPELTPDTAVLLRQVARWGVGDLRLPPLPAGWAELLRRVRVSQSPDGTLQAEPFAPDWLDDSGICPETPVDPRPRFARPNESVAGESYLPAAYPYWQSPAQKEAAWRVLTANPGSTTLVVLPTGTGKSLIFQTLARSSAGLTVVVVPTIALAIDQCRSALEVIPELNPVYFASRDDPQTTLAQMEEGRSRLVFTSPEACVSGRLRSLLSRAARDGRLDALVFDEAHIIDTWGVYFRVDFQLLAGLRQGWLDGSGGRLRTVLLTATLTPAGRDDLRTLFPPATGAAWGELVSQRLRPELIYFNRKLSEAERDDRVEEALWLLPRPAILYTTEVDHAVGWFNRLHAAKFRRIGCFHGDTKPPARRELLHWWRNNQLDLMIATSAFGLGVDKPDVRAVVHACFPEDLNRYYQEVGRGGRDGWSAVCMLLPTNQDRAVADRLGPKLLTPQLLQERWEGMWHEPFRRPTEKPYVWKIDPSAPRLGLVGKRTGRENVRWNKRLLMMLHRAGKIGLRDVEYEAPQGNTDEPREWLEVEIRFNPDSGEVGADIENHRRTELGHLERGLAMIDEYLVGDRCIGRVLKELYGDETLVVCGGCRACRASQRRPGSCPPLRWQSAPIACPASTVLGGVPDPARDRAGFADFLRGCLDRGIRHFSAGPDTVGYFRAALSQLYPRLPPLTRRPYRVDEPNEHDQWPDVSAGETLLAWHGRTAHPRLLGTSGAGTVVHAILPPLVTQELRYELQQRGAEAVGYFPNPAIWFLSLRG